MLALPLIKEEPVTIRDKMRQKISCLSNRELKDVWESLRGYDPDQAYEGAILMDEWAQGIHSEMSKRGLFTKV